MSVALEKYSSVWRRREIQLDQAEGIAVCRGLIGLWLRAVHLSYSSRGERFLSNLCYLFDRGRLSTTDCVPLFRNKNTVPSFLETIAFRDNYFREERNVLLEWAQCGSVAWESPKFSTRSERGRSCCFGWPSRCTVRCFRSWRVPWRSRARR